MLIHRMMVAACRVGLPNFNQRIGNRLFVFIHNLTNDDDAFAHRLFAGFSVAREIVLTRCQVLCR